MTSAPPCPPARQAPARPPESRTQRKPHGQRWGEGVASVLDHLQHDGRHLAHPAGLDRRQPRRERQE